MLTYHAIMAIFGFVRAMRQTSDRWPQVLSLRDAGLGSRPMKRCDAIVIGALFSPQGHCGAPTRGEPFTFPH
jgi:hypothetical protein